MFVKYFIIEKKELLMDYNMKKKNKINFLPILISYLIFNLFISVIIIPVYATDVANDTIPTKIGPDITGWPDAPEIIGEAALLIEADSGVVLYEKNSRFSMYPASITKLLTALLVFENCSLDEMVPFSHNAVFSLPAGASHIAINPGEELSVEHCLYGLLLASANEVANALAEYVGGSMDEFAIMMNNRMKELGAKSTNFVNPSGLHDDNHYTTCYDMALLCRELISNKAFLKINGTTSYIIPPTNLQPLKRPINTTHKLLKKGTTNYSGAFGGKTGYTDLAGNTLVTFAERDGMTLICIVMKSDSTHIYSDTTALLDYGFSYFKALNISQHETSFDFTQNMFNNNDYSLFINPNPILMLSEDSFVYIPITAKFEDLKYEIISDNCEDNVFSKITYTYNGHFVGETLLEALPSDIIEPAIPNTSVPNNEDNFKIVEILPRHIIIFSTIIVLIIFIILYLKFTRVSRIRRKRIRRQNRLQRKKLHK